MALRGIALDLSLDLLGQQVLQALLVQQGTLVRQEPQGQLGLVADRQDPKEPLGSQGLQVLQVP